MATVPAWSDLIHVILWRNDGFFHSFCIFSKSNAFGENFIRTKFILHKIFFQLSILSSRKNLCMFLNLHLKMTPLDFQLTIITHEGFSQFFLKNTAINLTLLLILPYLTLLYLTIPYLTSHLTLPYLTLSHILSSFTLPYDHYLLPYLTSYLTLHHTLPYHTLCLILPYPTLCLTLPYILP